MVEKINKENEDNQARKNVFDHNNENDIQANNVGNKYIDKLFDFSVMIAMIFVITTLLHQCGNEANFLINTNGVLGPDQDLAEAISHQS